MANLNNTHVTYVLDRSGSMSPIAEKTIESFNGLITEYKRSTTSVQVVNISLCLFDDKHEVVYNALNVHEVPTLTKDVYYARGSTSLQDGIAKAIILTKETLSKLPAEEQPGNVFIIVMTDGAENSSVEFKGEEGRAALKAMIQEQEGLITKDEAASRWNVVFMGANIDSFSVSSGYGIRAGNTANYHASAAGAEEAYTRIGASLSRSLCIPSFESDFFSPDVPNTTETK